ncbi:MAG: putative lipid II flippase FtsW [Anaerolineae bacterium]|nr:putative lipid II flippase FtsW [Anaerolineae bacterium]
MRQSQDRRYPSKPDYWVLAVTGLLLLFGLGSVYSAAMAQDPSDPTSLLGRQLAWSALGMVGMVVAARFDYRRWQLYTLPFLVLAVLLLLAVLIAGSEVFGSRRWFFRGSVQPSELTKLALIVYVAYWLSSKGPEIKQATYGLIPFSMLVGLVTALILLQPDFSTAVLIAGVAMIMFFMAGAEVWQLLAAGAIGLATVAALICTSPYRMERVFAFRDALRDPLSAGYHVRQTVLALGSGGLAGRGLGGGILKFGWLPAPHTDSIYAVIGEELGFIGCMAVLLLFCALAWRGFHIAARAEDSFGTFLAGGLTTLLVVQAGLNIAVATATVPFTGVPLPFISFGGSSLVVSLVAVGIVFNVSGHRIEG